MKKVVLNPVGMLTAGLALGILSRWLDLYTTNLGNVFSQLAIWILFGVLISIYSSTKRRAMGNILPFALGMLLTYYGAAIVTHGVYSQVYMIGWTPNSSAWVFCWYPYYPAWSSLMGFESTIGS